MHVSHRIVVALVVAALGSAGAVAAAAALRAGPNGDRPATPAAAGYRVHLTVTPNRSTTLNETAVVLTRRGRVVAGARVRLTTTMLDMPMPGVTRQLRYRAGRYLDGSTVLGMAGRWQLRIDVAPPHGTPFTVSLVDRVGS